MDGCFEVLLEAHESGGPYEMIVRDDADNKLVVHDVYYGEVFLCSGQSNMELTMYDVLDMFPEEISACDYPQIRTFKTRRFYSCRYMLW